MEVSNIIQKLEAVIPRLARRPLVLGLALVAAISPAAAWGPLGHRIVAETAALIVRDDLPDTWGPLLSRHRFELGVYAFLPDSRFRHIDGAGGTIEGPTHYLFLDAKPDEAAGSVDRRITQFVERAQSQLGPVRAPKGAYQRGATSEGDTRRVYLGLLELGLLSHYSGDVSMPYHATIDTNGYAHGEGGIHFYLENDCVDVNEPGLATDVLASVRKNRASWLASWGGSSLEPAALVRAVLKDSLGSVEAASQLDRKHAVVTPGPPGEKIDAVRKPASVGCAPLRALVVERLAKGAVLTAVLWERVLPARVDFSGADKLQFSDMEAAPDYPAPR